MHGDCHGNYENSDDDKSDDNDDDKNNSDLTAQTYWNMQCTGKYNSNTVKARLMVASSTGMTTNTPSSNTNIFLTLNRAILCLSMQTQKAVTATSQDMREQNNVASG
jgi:hypothetical protein